MYLICIRRLAISLFVVPCREKGEKLIDWILNVESLKRFGCLQTIFGNRQAPECGEVDGQDGWRITMSPPSTAILLRLSLILGSSFSQHW
jgi:hypothetical protein